MTGDPRRRGPAAPLDEASIAQLVHDVADGWTLPPQRLDAPSWRDRVRSPGARRLTSAGSWLARVGQAATAAIALTVVGALVAIIVTRPPDAAQSPAPSDGATPRSSADAQASLLPKLLVEGDLPNPSTLLARLEQGDFALVHLADGTIGGPITGKGYGSVLRVRADGSMVCLCVSASLAVEGNPTQVEVTLDRFDVDGQRVSSVSVETFMGQPDPRDVGTFVAERPPHVLTAMGFSAGGRYGFVGWSYRAHPAWRIGITVVDLQDGSLISRLELPDGTTGEGDLRQVFDAPRVVGSTSADRLLVAQGRYEWLPAHSENPTYRFQSEMYRVRFVDGRLSGPTSLPLAAPECGRIVQRAGGLPDDGTWMTCSADGIPLTVVRRLAADGSLLGDVRVAGSPGTDGDSTALSPDGKTLFVWDPATASITRIDLANGAQTTARGLTAQVDDGPLAAIGRWLAPGAAAKTFLRGAVMVSPDGRRVYAIGTRDGFDEPDQTGSAGVFVFDATSLETIDIWQPTADFVSLALSTDGRFAYVAGLPGVDALGRVRRDQQASITVFDTRDGSIRLIAGALDGELITFPTPTLD